MTPRRRPVDSLTVLDYYTDDPGHTQIGDQLSKCGTSIGVAKIDHQSVPGPTLIQKVLQQASSKSLPDVLMLDNPDIQQIAATGALAPLDDYGINADGYAPGPVVGGDVRRQAVRPAAGANTLAIFYNKDVLDKAGVQAAQDLGRAEGRGQEADRRQAVRLRVQRDRRLRGCVAVPAADVDQRRRRDQPDQSRRSPERSSSGRTSSTTARRPRAWSTGSRPT